MKVEVTAHGFRSSFRDWCADHGEDRELVEQALAHTVGGFEGAYRRSQMVERRAPLMQQWGQYVTTPRDDAGGEKVMQMRRPPAKARR
jgi:integrase